MGLARSSSPICDGPSSPMDTPQCVPISLRLSLLMAAKRMKSYARVGGILIFSFPAIDVALGLTMGVVAVPALGEWKNKKGQPQSTEAHDGGMRKAGNVMRIIDVVRFGLRDPSSGDHRFGEETCRS